MKQILGFVMLAACSLGMSSCGINHSQYSEDIIPWVYEKTIGTSIIEETFQTQRDKEFIDEYKCVEDTHEYPAFGELVYLLGEYYAGKEVYEIKSGVTVKLTNGDYYNTTYERTLLNNDFTDDEAEYYNGLFLAELDATAQNVYNYWAPWKEYYNEYALSHTQILDQGLDEINLGYKYTRYYVVYALTGYFDEVKYALVSIMEYDDGSNYVYQIVATADSLKEINQYLE